MTAKVLVEELMNSLLPVAHQMLAEHREFYPYGGYMDRDGRIYPRRVTDPETDYPKSADMIDALETTFRDLAREGKCGATAIICDVRVKLPGTDTKSDAIQVALEHVDEYSVAVFFPYRFVNDELVFGESFACRSERRIFGDEE
jgi:hypothetical protein